MAYVHVSRGFARENWEKGNVILLRLKAKNVIGEPLAAFKATEIHKTFTHFSGADGVGGRENLKRSGCVIT